MSEINVKVKRLKPDAVIPIKAHAHDAGLDLFAAEDVVIEPGETKKVLTGLAFQLPPGYEMQIRPRSGITLNTKLRVQLGTVDAGYVGEIGVIVDNLSDSLYCVEDGEVVMHVDSLAKKIDGEFCEDIVAVPYGTYLIRKGDKIAQAVINKLPAVTLTEVDTLGETDRGEGGFGSTGVNNKEAE